MASHHHEPHDGPCNHEESSEGSERPPHVFNRFDLLRNYQALERIASLLPPELLEQEPAIQMDALVGYFEHQLLHQHSDDGGHHHDHHHHHDEEGHDNHHQGHGRGYDHHDHGHEHVHGDQCDHSHDHHHGEEHDHHHHDEEEEHGHCHHADVDPWEEELKEDLLLVEYRRRILSSYKPFHSSVYDFNTWPIDPALKALVVQHPAHQVLKEPISPVISSDRHPLLRLMPVPNPNEVKDVPEGLRRSILELMKEVAPGIFVFDFLPASFCETLLEEIKNFEAWCDQNKEAVHRPNSMNNYGAILDDFGFEPVLEQLIAQYMNALSATVYPYIGATLDHHHGFTVAYEMGKDEDLSMHVDDSDVTLNVCLGRNFTKGELMFAGARCNHHQRTTHPLEGETVLVEHKVGKACLHIGRHRHMATSITSGERHNLILWCRSSKFRRLDSMLDCPDWCPISALIEAEAQAPPEAAPSVPSH